MRFSRQQGICGNDDGAIMLETLIALPVYLIVLAGIFWLGELCLVRQGLTTAERLRLWESGTRHAGLKEIPAAGIFWGFPAAASTRDALTTGVGGLTAGFADSPTDALGWGTGKTGYVQLNTRRSEWSWGIVEFVRSGLWSSSGDFTEEEQIRAGRDETAMASRTDADGNPLSSTVFFRRETDNGKRAEKTPYSGDPPLWDSIYLEQWRDLDAFGPPVKSSSGSAAALSEYGARKTNFNTWSLSLHGW